VAAGRQPWQEDREPAQVRSMEADGERAFGGGRWRGRASGGEADGGDARLEERPAASMVGRATRVAYGGG
jgi:hypothetical protein